MYKNIFKVLDNKLTLELPKELNGKIVEVYVLTSDINNIRNKNKLSKDYLDSKWDR